MANLLGYFRKQSRLFFALLGILVTLLIYIIDCATFDFSMFEFYLLPVAIAVWFAGRNVGIFMALVAAVSEIAADMAITPNHSSHWVHVWNFFLNLSFFIGATYLLEFLKKTLTSLENASATEKIINRQLHSEIEYRKHLEQEIRKTQGELRTLSFTDPLTGVYNRKGFVSLASQQVKVAIRNKQAIGLLFADLDGLKRINDNLGHQEGDQALIEVARVLKESFRESDVVARIGGDEFAALTLQRRKDGDNILVARVRENLDKYNTEAVPSHKLSLSIGIVYYNAQQPRTVDELLSEADKLVFEQKQAKI